MTSKQIGVAENLGGIILAKRGRIDNPDKSRRYGEIDSFELAIPWTREVKSPRGRDFIFYDNPDPIAKNILKVKVIGAAASKKSYSIDCVELEGVLTYVDASALCDEIHRRIAIEVAPRRLQRSTVDKLDCEVLETSRDK